MVNMQIEEPTIPYSDIALRVSVELKSQRPSAVTAAKNSPSINPFVRSSSISRSSVASSCQGSATTLGHFA